MGMIALDISTACGYNLWKEHYLVLLNPLLGDWDFPPMLLSTFLRNYWTPYRGIDTEGEPCNNISDLYPYWTPYRGLDDKSAILVRDSITLSYWTPYRGIETTLWYSASHLPSIEPLIGGLIRPCGNEELEMRNEKWAITFLGWTGKAGLHLITHC